MLSINMDDVMQVVSNIQNYLIAFGVVLVLALLVMFAVRKMPKAKKKMIRAQSGLAILLALAIVVNLICTGPMSTMLDLVSGEGSISEETSAEATELVNEITQEGIVLAQNDDNILPVASGSKLNVFGWASTSPCYGGTGSGALNDAYPVTDLLTGLHDAGIETNDELSKFYTDYCSTRPSVGMAQQDWTLPEPNVSLYTDEMMANAKAYSDTAMVVITRVGGEGADLPTDMSAVVDGSWVRRVADYRGSQRGAGYYNGTYDDTLNEGNDWDKGDHFLQLSNREEELIDLVTSNFDNVIVVYNGANAFEMDWVKNYPQIKGVLLCPGTGQSGFEGFGRVVAGEVNPSGRTADTYAADLTASPWWNNFGDFKYTNATELDSDSSSFGRTGKLDEDDWVKLAGAIGPLSEAEMYIDDTPGISVMEIRTKCRKLKMEKNIGLVVIDYLQLVQGNKRTASREQEISEISRSLKILAKEINVPVIALSQLSRAVEQRPDHRPMLSDLRESGAIEQDADIVMFLYRDDYYNKESEKKDIAEVIIAKQRGGQTGTVELLWMGNYTKFVNLERRFDD